MDNAIEYIVKGTVVRTLIIATNSKRLLLVESGDRPDQWELPGGKVERFETPEDAAERELREETGIKNIPLVLRHRFDKTVQYDPNTVWRHYFFSGLVSSEVPIVIDTVEITAYRWASLYDVLMETNIEYASKYYLTKLKPPKTVTLT